MNIKRHYITVISLFLATLLVIFGLKNVLPRELYVGLSILMGMLLVISYSVLDIIGFFTNREWILEEKMWLYKIGKEDTPLLALAQLIWYLPFFAFYAFWNSETGNIQDFSGNDLGSAFFSLFIYMLFTVMLSLFTTQIVGIYSWLSSLKCERENPLRLKKHEEMLIFIKNKRNYKIRLSYFFFILALLNSLTSILRHILKDHNNIFFPFSLNDIGVVSRFIIYIWRLSLPLTFMVICFVFYSYYCSQKILIGLTFATSERGDECVNDEVIQSRRELRIGTVISIIFLLLLF